MRRHRVKPVSRRWRLAYMVGLAVSVGALVGGLAFAALPSNGGGSGFASTSNVSLSVNASATRTCTYSPLTPGDLTGSSTCTLGIGYTGSTPAFVSLTVSIQAKAGSGGKPLYDGTNSTGLTLSLKDNGDRSFTVPTGTGSTGGSCPVGFTCWTSAFDLAAWYTGSGPTLAFTSTSPAVTFTLTPLYPTTVNNFYQGGSATVTLTAQAVQTTANSLPAGCTTTTIGQPCPATGSFAWS